MNFLVRGRRRMPALAVAAGLCLVSAAAIAQQAPLDRAQLDKRLLSVGRLIEQSSVSRRIEAGGDAAALARRDKAREIYRQAQQARDSGDYAAAARLAGEASTLMFEAARRAGPDPANAERERAAFDARMQSVKSLLAAQQRISAETGKAPEGAETGRSIESLMADAARLRAAGQPARAMAALDKAYLAAKAAVSSLRRGETLVRSVHFATREEEYRYELERNDTHMTLIKALQGEEPRMAGVDGTLGGFIKKATELRGQAEQAARGGDHGAAIERLEGSTRELVRAIRSLGIFVPG